MTVSSLKERTTYKPNYSFPVQLSSPSTSAAVTAPQNVLLKGSMKTSPPTTLAPIAHVPSVPSIYPSTSFNPNQQQLIYFYNNILVTSQNFC